MSTHALLDLFSKGCMLDDALSTWQSILGRRDVEINSLRVFLYLSANPDARAGGPGIPQAEIVKASTLSEASTSRTLATLSTGATGRAPAPLVIETFVDPENARCKRVRLTPFGQMQLEALLAPIRGTVVIAPAETVAPPPVALWRHSGARKEWTLPRPTHDKSPCSRLYRRGKVWYADVHTADGQRLRRSTHTGDKLQADQVVKHFVAALHG